jgi:hypothetical protein
VHARCRCARDSRGDAADQELSAPKIYIIRHKNPSAGVNVFKELVFLRSQFDDMTLNFLCSVVNRTITQPSTRAERDVQPPKFVRFSVGPIVFQSAIDPRTVGLT